MLENILFAIVGLAIGGLVCTIIYSNMIIKSISDMADLKVDYVKAIEKNHTLFDKNQKLEMQLHDLIHTIFGEVDEDDYLDYFGDW